MIGGIRLRCSHRDCISQFAVSLIFFMFVCFLRLFSKVTDVFLSLCKREKLAKGNVR